jgi:gamma-glutamyltranspeptidase/glutathione hydrolase
MKGAVAAGHPLTAEAGARILTEGGNAVDACVAAGFASWVVESPLAGPGGGGFMLVHRAGERSARLLDFFVAVPGLGRRRPGRAAMEEVDVDFDRETSQLFRIGPASVAVPGTAAGLGAAHRAYGSLPWRRLVEPAIELARGGFEMTTAQAYLHTLLDAILRHTSEGSRVYGNGASRLAAGDRVRLSDLAGTLELIAEQGAAAVYRGDLARAVLRHVREAGGELTQADLDAYRVIVRRPVVASFRGRAFVANSPPSAGGVLIAYGLRLLERLGKEVEAGSAEAIARLVEVSREQSRAREEPGFGRGLYRGGLAGRLCSDESVRAAVARIRRRLAVPEEVASPGGTTHISAVDAAGNAASLSSSIGSGSGVIVPGTGVHLNNMLGEHDLNPAGASARPGRRLTSMMAPSIVLEEGRPRLVVGSAGSARLRGAIMQIVVNVVVHGLPVGEAIDRPRVHADGLQVHCEGGHDPGELDRLEAWGYELTRWRQRNLFFGGASGVELRRDGTLAAAGDPRRGGHGIVVAA